MSEILLTIEALRPLVSSANLADIEKRLGKQARSKFSIFQILNCVWPNELAEIIRPHRPDVADLITAYYVTGNGDLRSRIGASLSQERFDDIMSEKYAILSYDDYHPGIQTKIWIKQTPEQNALS